MRSTRWELRIGVGLPPKVFVGHSIYKRKAALTVEPRPPEFLPLNNGSFKLSREGYVMLQFAPAAGVRQYDWSRKQIRSLAFSNLLKCLHSCACYVFTDINEVDAYLKLARGIKSLYGIGGRKKILYGSSGSFFSNQNSSGGSYKNGVEQLREELSSERIRSDERIQSMQTQLK